MTDYAIRAEGLAKRFRIGLAARRHDSLREAVASAATAPFRRLRDLGRAAGGAYAPDRPDEVWALEDVSFELKRGEVLGIVGRNGAGKSTLLKILSRITDPTLGRAEVRGRVGSLLEVGTGFHPELSGRDNVYLNGSILGMDRAHIARQFDEIVEFSGVERFIDTPVKRYSSGMYLRLAFAVAAHLEPDILILDEVLAVGDAEFQNRCLGRMGEVAREGRTVLFVSHNMAAVRALCGSALLMKDGRVNLLGDVEAVVSRYLSEGTASGATVEWAPHEAPQSPEIRFSRAAVLNHRGEPAAHLDCREGFTLEVEYEVLQPLNGLRIGFYMQTPDGIPVCGSNDPEGWEGSVRPPGRYISRCEFPGYTLNAGRFSLFLGADAVPYAAPLASTPYCLSFTIEDVEGHGPAKERLPGIVRPRLVWRVRRNSAAGA